MQDNIFSWNTDLKSSSSHFSTLLGRFVYGGVFLLIIFAVLVPLVCGAIFKVHYFKINFTENILSILLLAIVPFLVGIYIAIAPRISIKVVLFSLLLFIFFSRLFYILYIQDEFFSDYRTMWNFVLKFIDTHRFILPTILPEKRTLFYLLPVTYIFNGSSFGFQFANAFAITLSAFLIYFLAASFVNQRAGLIALVIIAFAPEPLVATAVPTHDIPGTLYLLLSITLAMFLLKLIFDTVPHLKKLLLFSILLGTSINLTDSVRDIGIVILLTIIIATILVLTNKRQEKKAQPRYVIRFAFIFLIFIPFLTSYILNYMIRENFLSEKYNDNRWLWVAAYSNSQSVGDYSEFMKLFPYMENLSNDELREFAIHKSLSDLYYNPIERMKGYLRKAMRLYHLGRQHDDYYGNIQKSEFLYTDDQIRNLQYNLSYYSETFSIFFIIASIITIIMLLFLQKQQLILLLPPLIFTGVLTLILLLAGEAQSRYMFPAWFILPMYMGTVAVNIKSDVFSFNNLRNNIIDLGIVFMTLTALIALVFIIFSSWYSFEKGRMILASDWETEGNVNRIGDFSISLRKSSDEISAWKISKELKLSNKLPYTLTFFSKAPQNEATGCSYTLEVNINQSAWSKVVNSDSSKPSFWKVEGIAADDGKLYIEIYRGNIKNQGDSAVTQCQEVYLEYLKLSTS